MDNEACGLWYIPVHKRYLIISSRSVAPAYIYIVVHRVRIEVCWLMAWKLMVVYKCPTAIGCDFDFSMVCSPPKNAWGCVYGDTFSNPIYTIQFTWKSRARTLSLAPCKIHRTLNANYKKHCVLISTEMVGAYQLRTLICRLLQQNCVHGVFWLCYFSSVLVIVFSLFFPYRLFTLLCLWAFAIFCPLCVFFHSKCSLNSVLHLMAMHK